MILSSAEKIKDYTAKGWWGRRTLDDAFQEARLVEPERLALADAPNRPELTGEDPRRLTYRELGGLTDKLAARFLRDGLKKDDIICTQLPNIVEGVLVILAAARLGVVVSPIPIQYREHEINHILNQTRARALVTVSRFKNYSPGRTALDLMEKYPDPARLYTFGDDAPEGACPLTFEDLAREDISGVTSYLKKTEITANDILTICWTSGTEATPKGVPRSHNHWFATGRICCEAGTLGDGDHLLNPFPMVNMAAIGSMLFPWIMCKGTLIQHHPFDLQVFLKQISTEKINYTIAAPAILNMLLKNGEILGTADLNSLKCLGSGSAPLSPWMVRCWQEDHDMGVMNFFGSNEGTALFSSVQDIPDPVERAQYFPRFGVDGFTWEARSAACMHTRLVDMETGDVITAANHPGELRIKGATMFDGYFGNDGKAQEAFDAEGYFKTGDTFAIAGEGHLARFYKFLGRSKEIIIRGGMNISPGELDGLLEGHPSIKEAAVVGYPDETLGEKVCAVIVTRNNQPVSLEDLKEYLLNRNIAAFKIPERLCHIEALPRNPMGKVLRRELLDYLDP